LLQRFEAGGEEARQARDQLVGESYARLRAIARKVLHGDFPALRGVHETDSILHDALLRLYQALQQGNPKSIRHFFHLSALQIRRVLLDVARQQGRQAARFQQPPGLGAGDSQSGAVAEPTDCTHDPRRLAQWADFHERAQDLPEDEREVFDLLFYQGLTQPQAARVLGVSERTVKYRWQAARLRLREVVGGDLTDV
jgi:RNA polymerase sigma factor (sigma-70 family)